MDGVSAFSEIQANSDDCGESHGWGISLRVGDLTFPSELG
jgi:hypothetical protein